MQSSTSTSKAISMKRGRGQLRSTSKGNTTLNSNSKSESLEIEEISKKISEHADALYRTWKSRGLVPPTDLLELYTVEAAAVAAAGTSKEALQSTEGLQNLVNTFVIKDKEQRNNNNGANGKMAGNRIGIETIGAKKPTKLSNTSQISKFKATNVTEKITTATTTTATTITLLTPNENRKIIDNTSTNSFLKSFTQESLHNAHIAATNKISLANKSKSSAVMEKLNKTIDDKIVEKCDKLIDDHINKYSKIGKISAATSINNIKQNSTKLKTSNSNDKISDKMELIDDVITPDNAIIKTQSFISSIHAPLEKLLTTTTTTTTKTKTDEAAMNAMNALEKNLNFDIDLDLKIDLNLNVQQLSQLQTQNLRKIKELLQDNNCKTPTRIPTPANSAFLTHAREKKPLKITTASTLPSTSSSLSLLPSSSSLLSSSSSSLLLVNDIKQQHQQAQQQQQQQWTTNENHQDDRKFAVMGRNGKTNELVVNGTVKSAHDSSKDRESNQTVGTKSLIRQPLQRVFEDNKNGNCNGINKSQEKFLVNTSVTNSNSSVTNSHLKTNANANANENMSTIDVEYTLQQKQQQHSNNQVIAPIVCSVQSDVTSVMTAFNTSHTAISSSDEIENPTIQITAVPATTTIKTTIATINNKNKMSKRTKVTNKIKDHKLKDNSIKIQQQAETSSIITQNKEELPIDSDTLLPLSLSTSLSSSSISSLSPISTQLSLSPVTSSSSDPTIVSLPNNVETAHKSNNGSDSTNNSCVTAANPMPTPMKLKSQRNQLGNGQEKNLRSNFLTRGSVAERVLMFEKCPDVRHAFLNIKRPDCVEPPKPQIKVKLHSTPPQPPKDHTSLQREYKALKSVYIPRFYFPHGKPQPQIAVERTLRGILSAFDTFPNNQVTKDELPRILKICGLPFYWRTPVLIFCQQGNNNGMVERQRFVEFWKQMNVYCHEEASRFVYILSRGQRFRNYILPEDLVPLVQDVVDIHPGLAFLKEATEFHSRYVHTVIARIFYTVNRSWSGKISISELKKSDLLEILCLLEEEDDINQIMAFFSYEHFYVIYCKFWELDKDHDLLINQDDLARHSDHALSTRIIERIFSGCVTRNDNRKNPKDEPKMSYTDFVWFLLSEEDKRTPTAIEYWFRCMDLDGDGVLSMYELEYFYEEQQQRMESIGIESLPFEDCLCQMLDMIKPQKRDAITLGDLKRCKMTHVFFDTFFNLEKYLDHEQRDPFATQRDEYGSDWDRFAAQEYELLITEEND